jgi:hypothetical protein
VLADGIVVGRIFRANASPVGASWMLTLPSGTTRIEAQHTAMPRRARRLKLRHVRTESRMLEIVRFTPKEANSGRLGKSICAIATAPPAS